MAYGNWGGWVYRNGVRMDAQCDATVRQVLGQAEPYVMYFEHFMKKAREGALEKTDRNALDEMYHAIVGSPEAGLIVALYKDWVAHAWVFEGGEAREVDAAGINVDYDDEEWQKEGTVGDVAYRVNRENDPHKITVTFTGRDASAWEGWSGYGIGQRYEE
jgi:hypothetical protein